MDRITVKPGQQPVLRIRETTARDVYRCWVRA